MFTHLQVASSYSMQFGTASPSELVAASLAQGASQLALTDRDGLYGAVKFATACKKAGISPIIGVDFSLADSSRVVILAKPGSGWASLCQLVTWANAHPNQLTAKTIAAWPRLVVLLTSQSTLGRLASSGNASQALKEIHAWKTLFKAENLAVAITDHQSGGSGLNSTIQATRMYQAAQSTNTRCVLTNQVRMLKPLDAMTCDVLDAVRQLRPLSESTITRRNAEGWLKPAEQMAAVAGRIAGSRASILLGETLDLADECCLDPTADIGLSRLALPRLLTADGELLDAPRELKQRCQAGLYSRYSNPSQQIIDRLSQELAVINKLGFANYFLTVKKVVDAVHDMGLRCSARGSGAGSLVNYLLGISGVDPIANNLLMERFMSPLRRKMPDIDLDVEAHRRDDIYQKIATMFKHVACLAMFDTYRVRGALRDVGAALSLPPAEISALARAFPHVRATQARQAIKELPQLRQLNLKDEQLKLLFDLVESLDGLPRHIALHPCGVLICDETLPLRTPLQANKSGVLMSQFDKDDIDALGLLKLDILGVRMQSAMSYAVSEVARTTNTAPDIDALSPFDDPNVYKMIQDGQTLGCFQIESPGQRELVRKLSPATFNDLVIDISLFRPGPVKTDMVTPFLDVRQGWTQAKYLHPSLKPILAETNSVVVFHEQVIRIIATVTGCSLARADECRRDLANPQASETLEKWFVVQAEANGYSSDTAAKIWATLVGFAAFGFCKAHAVAFALSTYQSAWLKWYWPAHFIAGVLTHDPGMYPKRLLVEEARRMGVQILGLDINKSSASYHVEKIPNQGADPVTDTLPDGSGWAIRLALSDVKGIPAELVAQIESGQPYTSLTDFWQRTNTPAPLLERLASVGAFDAIYANQPVNRRDILLACYDLAHESKTDTGKAVDQPAFDFAAGSDVKPAGLEEMSQPDKLHAEIEVLGMDATSHVMDYYQDFLATLHTRRAVDLINQRNNSTLLVAGAKVATQTPSVRSGKRVVFLTIDDGCGPIDATFFADAQEKYAATVFSSWLLIVRGTLRRTGPRGVTLRASGAWSLPNCYKAWLKLCDRGLSKSQAGAIISNNLDKLADAPTLTSVELRKMWHASLGSPG